MPFLNVRVKKSSHDLYPLCSALGSQWNISSNVYEVPAALLATVSSDLTPCGLNHPSASVPRTLADSGDERNLFQTFKTFFSFRQHQLDSSTHLSIDCGVLEHDETRSGAHWPVQQCVDWHTDDTCTVSRVGPVGRGSEDVIDELEQMGKVSNSRILACWIGHVLFVGWHLISVLVFLVNSEANRPAAIDETCLLEHHFKQHVQSGILLDHLLQLYKRFVQLFRVRVNMLNCVVQKLVMVSLVLRHPVSSLSVSAAL